MAIAGNLLFTQGTVPASPGAGVSVLYSDTADGRFKFIGSDGIVKSIDSDVLNSIIASTAGIANTSTIISGGTSSLHLSANELTAGSLIRVNIIGTCTAGAAGTQVFTLYYGTAGTTSDTAICTFTITSATSGSTIAFNLELLVTIRTIGSSGTLYGAVVITNTGTTGIYTASGGVIIAAGTLAINTQNAGYLNVGYISGSASVTTTFQNVIIEVVKQ